jgi:hypothetical protein
LLSPAGVYVGSPWSGQVPESRQSGGGFSEVIDDGQFRIPTYGRAHQGH